MLTGLAITAADEDLYSDEPSDYDEPPPVNLVPGEGRERVLTSENVLEQADRLTQWEQQLEDYRCGRPAGPPPPRAGSQRRPVPPSAHSLVAPPARAAPSSPRRGGRRGRRRPSRL